MKYFCFICGILGSFLILSTAGAAFVDVSSNHPNYESINYVQGKKIVQGYSDGSFKPNAQINRAELTKIIIATNYDEADIKTCGVGTIGLSDVAANAWFASFVCAAKQRNIIKGYDDGTFKPAQNVTFVEAAKIISLGFGQQLPEDPEVWFRPYVEYLSSQSAIPDSITTMAQNITRGEMAEMIYRLHAAVESRPAQAFDDGELKPMTDEIKAEQKAQSTTSTTTPATNTTTNNTTDTNSDNNTESGGSTSGGSSSPNQPPQNPMICKSCPAGTIGQPGNNCACEQAYLEEQCYGIEQCGTLEFTCGEGYEYYINDEMCGCKLKADILTYWLVSDASFKVNALDEKPPISHGVYQELDSAGLQAALGVKNMILFFHADWCPSCIAADQEIKDRIQEIPADAVIFKTDYDAETTLREKFEITAQHSIVIIDKNNALQFKQTGFTFDDIVSVLEKIGEAEELSE